MVKNIKSLGLSVVVIFSFVLNGCGESGTKVNSGDKASVLKTELEQLGKLSQRISVPSMPNENESKSTVSGVDINHNGTRDDLEQISYQALKVVDDISISAYTDVLSIVKMIQPANPPIANSINKHDIYCKYRVLPDAVKEELPLSFLYGIVLDTKERKSAFASSLASSTVNLGAESCE